MEKTSHDTKKAEELSTFGKLLQWAVYPFSLAAGYVVARINVSNSAYDNVKGTGAFEAEKSRYKSAMLAVGKDANHALATGKEFDFRAATKPIVEAHDAKIVQHMKDLKLGIFPKQWVTNSPYQQQNALLAGLTAAGIGVAVGAMFTDSKKFREWFSPKTEGQEQAR